MRCFAPSIKPPIEPVVSRAKTISSVFLSFGFLSFTTSFVLSSFTISFGFLPFTSAPERVKPNTINRTAQSSKALQNSVFQNIVFISKTSAGKCLRRGGSSHRRLADGTAHSLNGDGRPPCADSKPVGQTTWERRHP